MSRPGSSTMVTPGHVQDQECFYTFHARTAGSRWYINNFRQPKLDRE